MASKLCGWDIEIMTREELDQQIERAIAGFSSIEGLDDSVAERLVGEGFLSYDDLSVIEPEDLMEMGGLSAEAVDAIVEEAERRAAMAEVAAADERRRQREQERIAKATADADAADAAGVGDGLPEDAMPSPEEAVDETTPAGENASSDAEGAPAQPATEAAPGES
jgi:N utilization substance protein A